jgi:hypothetical protein
MGEEAPVLTDLSDPTDLTDPPDRKNGLKMDPHLQTTLRTAARRVAPLFRVVPGI